MLTPSGLLMSCSGRGLMSRTRYPRRRVDSRSERAGLAIITRDKRIATRTAEINAVIAAGARMFAITSAEKLHTWDLLSIAVARRQDFEAVLEDDGPYIYSVTRTTLSKVDLQAAPLGHIPRSGR
jgi:PIN like domain